VEIRDAEATGGNLILPIAANLAGAQVIKTIDSVMENSQIYDATGMPRILDRHFAETSDHLAESRPAWLRLVIFLKEEDEDRTLFKLEDNYSRLIAKIMATP
jgi:hypothetical protein